MCTDNNKTYKYYKIAKHHIISKSETCLAKSFNLSLKDMLARLHRRTKSFSKNIEMLYLTLIMFFINILLLISIVNEHTALIVTYIILLSLQKYKLLYHCIKLTLIR